MNVINYNNLVSIIRDFIEEHHISCPEVIYQSDRVIENAYELIEHLADQVGYYIDPDDEVSGEYLEQLELEKHREESYGGNFD